MLAISERIHTTQTVALTGVAPHLKALALSIEMADQAAKLCDSHGETQIAARFRRAKSDALDAFNLEIAHLTPPPGG